MSGIISKIYYNVECGKFTYLLWKIEQMFDKIITVNELEIFRNISALQAGKENESEDSKYESKRTYRETKYQYKSI